MKTQEKSTMKRNQLTKADRRRDEREAREIVARLRLSAVNFRVTTKKWVGERALWLRVAKSMSAISTSSIAMGQSPCGMGPGAAPR